MIAAGQAAAMTSAIKGMRTWLQRTSADAGVEAALGDAEGRLKRWMRENLPDLLQRATE